MNRKHNFCLLACLLALLHMAAQAQSLTGYEYWFDGKVSSRVSESLSGDEAVINTKISTQHLSSGLHTLHLRFKQSGGEYNYSPVTSQLFFNHNAEEGGTVEYWFDSDIDKRATVPLPSAASDETVDVALIMTDAMKFPLGFHQLNMRVATEGKSLSNIYTAYVLKVPSGDIDALEYWVDEDFDNRQIVEGHIASSDENADIFVNPFDLSNVSSGPHRVYFRPASKEGNAVGPVSMATVIVGGGIPSRIEYWFDNNIAQKASVALPASAMQNLTDVALVMNNAEKFPLGMHLLNMRLVTEGREQSPIYSARVMRKASGEIDVIEYWVDGDYENRRTITGHVASTDENAYVFTNSFDLHDVTEGFHRIYYRGTSASGNANTAVSMTPVMVKSRYNIDSANVKMKSFMVAVDNEEPVTVNVAKDDELILNPYLLNARDLSVGNHTLKAHFWNTANAGVALEQAFKVNKIEPPTITLTAQEKDGRVTLKLNSIPNDVKWAVARIDANGASAKIGGKEESRYPSEITVVDNPSAGSYKYKARSYYIDADGTKKAANSNEVEVAVVAPDNGPYGKISGSIRNANGNVMFAEMWEVTFSDGVTIGTDWAGCYFRDKIPVGTKLEITVKSSDFSCEPVTVTVKEGTNLVFHTAIFDEDLVRSRYTSDLEFDSFVEFEPRLHMKFKVRNRTRLPWRGKVRVVTGRKEFMDNPPKNPLEDPNWAPETQVLAGSVAAPFTMTDNIQYDYSDEIYLSSGESKEVFITHHIPLTFPSSEKDELYYFFVESVDEYGTKLVGINEDYNIKENPLVQMVNNGQYDAEKRDEEEVESCIALVMGLCSTVTEFDGKLGDMSKCMEEMQQTLGSTLEYYLLADKIERATNYSQILNSIPEWHFYHILYLEDRRFLGMVNSVRDNIAKEVRACKNVLKYLKDVKKCIDLVKGYNQWHGMNEMERTGAIAEKILDLAENKVPFANILKMYLDVTRTTIHNINGLAEKWYANHDYDTFYNGKGIYAGSDFKFDIRVKKKGWISRSFDAEDLKERIYSVEINCIGHVAGNDPFRCTATYTPEVEDGKLRLHRINLTGVAPSSGGIVPIEDMWMTIRWSNGRVSHVPIRNSEEMQGNGVKHDKNHYTITFQSANSDVEHMADIIFLDD